MPTYLLAQMSVHDPARYERYAAAFWDTIRPFDGRLLAAQDSPSVLEGDWPYERAVLIEFSSREEADRWARSDAYQAIVGDRLGATTGVVLAIEGLPHRPRPLDDGNRKS